MILQRGVLLPILCSANQTFVKMFHSFIRIDDIFDNDEYNSDDNDGDFDPETRNKDKDDNNVTVVLTQNVMLAPCSVFRAPCKDIDKDKDKDKEEDKDKGQVEF